MKQRVQQLTRMLSECAEPSDALAGRLPDGRIECRACAHRCQLPDGASGICRMRTHRDGSLYVPRGYIAGMQIDPVEKKPFYHVLPGETALSYGLLGCNFRCGFCQNWVSSQALKDENAGASVSAIDAETIVELAVRRGSKMIVSTYNEPLISSEWSHEIFTLAKKKNIRCGYVSNGFATTEALDFLADVLDFMNVDLKTFDDAKYRTLGGELQPVLDTIRQLVERGIFAEIVTLLVPGLNDGDDELSRMADFIASVSPTLPWHISAFHADYKMTDRRSTSMDDLLRAAQIAKSAGIKHIYLGNRGDVGEWENTRCASCGSTLIRRSGYLVRENRLAPGGGCPDCGATLAGRWD
ncbi:MAG: AmmeMemoRadiSam system radical SAM enzyme [Planctomycetota bacterium]